MIDLVITDGLVATPRGDMDLDIGIEGEKIVALAAPGTLSTVSWSENRDTVSFETQSGFLCAVGSNGLRSDWQA